MIRILCVGKTDFKYNRTAVLLAGLEKLHDVELSKFSIKKRDKSTKQEIKSLAEHVDFIYIPPFRHRDVSFVKKLTKTPIVFDPLISKYLTKVVDYNQPWKAPLKYFCG